MLVAERAKRAVRNRGCRAQLRRIEGAVAVLPEKIFQSPQRSCVPPVRTANLDRLAFAQAPHQYARQSLLDRPGDLGAGEDVGSAPGEAARSFMQVQQFRQKARRRFDRMQRCKQLASVDDLSGSRGITGRQCDGAPLTGPRGSIVPLRSLMEHDHLAGRQFEAVDVYLLTRRDGEDDAEYLRVDRRVYSSRKGFLASLKGQPVEPDRRGLGAKLAAPGDNALSLRVTDRCLIDIGVGKGANGTPRHRGLRS